MNSNAPPYDSASSAWTSLQMIVRQFVEWIAPATLRAEMYVSGKRRLEILSWLRPLEHAARRLFLADALRVPVPDKLSQKRKTQKTKPHAKKAIRRASFRGFPKIYGYVTKSGRPAPPQRHPLYAIAFAARIEALAHALDTREQTALRWARALWRRERRPIIPKPRHKKTDLGPARVLLNDAHAIALDTIAWAYDPNWRPDTS